MTTHSRTNKMAFCRLLCTLFVCWNINPIEGATTHLKGLLCQDPDTRKLHPINSTWPSETFCGNYTCRLRQKNLTQTEYVPVTKTNITAPEKNDKTLSSDMETNPSDQAFVVIKKVQPEKQFALNKEAVNRMSSLTNEYKNTDTDRYLTESEINSITEILHTVKKSDLEAIVEIYNIAQDIYKEINAEDKATFKTKNTTYNMKTAGNSKHKFKNNDKESVSYWYEPLHHVNTKVKPTDLKVESTNALPIAKSYSYPATYFNGPLTERDFRKLPYYYPLSEYQRLSSYRHRLPQNQKNNAPRQPCNKKFNYIAPTWVNAYANANSMNPGPAKQQTMQQILLPYPYSYIHNYNYSTYPASVYYSNYPWPRLDNYYRIQNYQQPLVPHISQVPETAVAANVREIEQKSVGRYSNGEENTDKSEEINLPEWQTKELSAKVLEEVKANILDDTILLKPLNIGKNIKLEKVRKVIKVDDLTRRKRDVRNVEDNDIQLETLQYETYVEKTTCDTSIELGYFSIGNLSEPYPACCPRKIS